jgi:high-affinity K+ transport system ATPase subunit B
VTCTSSPSYLLFWFRTPPARAAGLAFISWGITGDWTILVLAVVLLVVVFLTCALNYFQERSASNVLASIRSMLPAACVVVRDGAETKVPATQLVVGDVVHLTIGNRIPADIRIIHVSARGAAEAAEPAAFSSVATAAIRARVTLRESAIGCTHPCTVAGGLSRPYAEQSATCTLQHLHILSSGTTM